MPGPYLAGLPLSWKRNGALIFSTWMLPSCTGSTVLAISSAGLAPSDYFVGTEVSFDTDFHNRTPIIHLPGIACGICRCAGQLLGRQTLKFLSYRSRELLSGCSLDYLCSKTQERLPR
jgi:hypothetical protein